MRNTENDETMDALKTRMFNYVNRSILQGRNREDYIIKSDDVPADELVIIKDTVFFYFQSNPKELAEVIRDVLKKMGKRYFITINQSTFLATEMRYYLETGLAIPYSYALIDEKDEWRGTAQPYGAAVVFELR